MLQGNSHFSPFLRASSPLPRRGTRGAGDDEKECKHFYRFDPLSGLLFFCTYTRIFKQECVLDNLKAQCERRLLGSYVTLSLELSGMIHVTPILLGVLAVVHKAKRVVVLKQIGTGLLVIGPYKLRR